MNGLITEVNRFYWDKILHFQVKRTVDRQEQEDEKNDLDKCTICLSEFVEEEDVRYNHLPNHFPIRPLKKLLGYIVQTGISRCSDLEKF